MMQSVDTQYAQKLHPAGGNNKLQASNFQYQLS